ncbi:hypothetical protein C8A00DRAFT_40720 [Chaetomidium leptoderma]|uniref:ubiquitinyl hydrolase 1 n=1 Tax=Chaetomidium leptoderma TaxID=669021 RepID=A0AAN6VT27_9PEZI|nr:hypothetical protein C8A00DRAFT_40720 [Chaetomidium leptoderma]
MALGNGDQGPSLPVRRSGRVRKRPSNHSENADYETKPSTRSPVSGETRRNAKRKAAPEVFDVPDNLLEASLGPWGENEQSEWPSWIELESDPAFFTAILGLLGVKGARIEEVLSVDEDSLAALPPPVYGLVFLYEYVSEESVEAAETTRDVWFANQTTQNACATIALLNIIMNAEGLGLGEKLRQFKQESKDLSPPLRGNMINDSDWIRVAHNSFARRLDLLNAALALQNDVDDRKKRARTSTTRQKKKKVKREKVKKDKSSGNSAYHFIAFVPVGQQVWQLDGLTSTPVFVGEYEKDQHWTSVVRPVIQERMMRYETERLSFSLLALCGDNLTHVRQKLATNVRSLVDLEAQFGGNGSGSGSSNPDWHSKTKGDIICNPTDNRLLAYQLDAQDIHDVAPDSEANPSQPPQDSPELTVEAALELWEKLGDEQKRILAEYDRELKMGGQEATTILGRTRDYTAAVHEWVKRLADRGHDRTRCSTKSRDRHSEQYKTKKNPPSDDDMSKRSSAAAANGAASKDASPPTTDKQKVLLSTDTGHFSLVRAMHLADLITEMNGLCGILSLFSSMRYCLGEPTQHGNLWAALLFLPFGLFFDFLDGKVARWRKKSSMMGQELDSLADLISFGVSPAAVAFAIGMRTPLDHLCLAFFVLCGLTRLARFNVTASSIPTDASGKARYFEGTPIPTTLGLDALMGWWVSNGWIHDALPGGVCFAGSAFEVHPVVVLFMVHGCLMTSRTIHIPKP